ncbi:ABC transporter permease, partial [Streptomyces celluloflavus]
MNQPPPRPPPHPPNTPPPPPARGSAPRRRARRGGSPPPPRGPRPARPHDPDTPRHDTGPVPADLTALITDRYGVPYPMPLDRLAADGRPHTFTVDLAAAAGAPAGRPAGPLRLTGLLVDLAQTPVSHRQRLTLDAAQAVTADGRDHSLTAPESLRWQAAVTDNSGS